MRIVLVEDNRDLSDLICGHLNKANIQCEPVYNGDDALDIIDADVHDAVILDRGLPDMDGVDVLKILREGNVKIPVLILTAMDGLGDKLAGLNSGADDYLVKPFEMDELQARLYALCRRPAELVNVVMRVGNVEFAPAQGTLKVGDKETELTLKEKEALERLFRLPGRVVGKDTLQNALYGHGEEGSKNSIEVVIHRLRKKLEKAGSTAQIHTLRGIGYLVKDAQ